MIPQRHLWLVCLGVLLLHAGALWALQSGLLQHSGERVAAVRITMASVEIIPPKVQAAAVYRQTPTPTQQRASKIMAVQPPPVRVPGTQTTNPQVIASPAFVTQTLSAPSEVDATPVQTPAQAPAQAQVSTSTVLASPVMFAPSPVLDPHPVELPSSDADHLQNPRPEYPSLSRRRGEQGRVLVKVLIGIDGVAQKAMLYQSCGFDRLDQAALTAVQRWRYLPGKRSGVPEAMWFNVPVNFVLK